MASFVSRRSAPLLRSTVAAASRPLSTSTSLACDQADKDKTIPMDALTHATSVRKYELMCALAGNDDPFMLRGKTGKGTKEEPTLVDSMIPNRLVGCMCPGETHYVTYFFLQQHKPFRCRCGHWYLLRLQPPINLNEVPL